MKQYNKIWVPEKKQGMAFRDAEGDTPSIITGPMICMTIDEFKLAWRAGMAHGVRPYDTESWDDYLTSKGIKID